jgi:hypothetical protein
LVKIHPGQLLVVDHEVSDRNCLKVDPQISIAWSFLQVEIDDCLAHIMVTFVDGDLEVILDLVDKFESFFSFSPLQSNILVVTGVEMGTVTKMFGHESTSFN